MGGLHVRVNTSSFGQGVGGICSVGKSGSLPDVRLVATALLWPSKTISWLLQAALHTNIIIII